MTLSNNFSLYYIQSTRDNFGMTRGNYHLDSFRFSEFINLSFAKTHLYFNNYVIAQNFKNNFNGLREMFEEN